MNFKSLLYCSFFLLISFSSCGVKESIQRDIIVTTSPIAFTIPIITSTDTEVTLGEFSTTVSNLDDVIKQSTNGQFTKEDLQSIKISGYKIDLEEEENEDDSNDDDINNFIAFQSIKVQIESAGQPDIELANQTGVPEIKSFSIVLPITDGNKELKDYLTGNVSYKIIGIGRNPTTKPIKAIATAQYKLTVGK